MTKISPSSEPPAPIDETASRASWFFENAQDLFVIIRPDDRRILAANPAWEATTGWSVDELVGRDLFEFVDAEDVPALVTTGRRLAEQGRSLAPFRLRRKDGAWLWLEGYARQGPAGELMGTLRDVTRERLRQQKLDDADQLRSLLSQTAGVGLWSYDPRTNVLDWSAEMRALLTKAGAKFEDSAGFFELCHPDDVEHVQSAMRQVIAGGPPMAFDHRMRAAEGRWLYMRVHIHGEPLADGQHRVHGLSQDITALAEAREIALHAERQSRRLMEEAPFAVALFDKDLRYAMASPRWQELFQPEGLDFLGRRLDELGPEVYRDFVKVQAAALEGHSTRAAEHRLVDTRGRVFWIRWEVCPWRDPSGAIAGVVVYVDDISDLTVARREAQAQAQRLKIALGAARAAVIEADYKANTVWSSPELIAMTGHDLTGPPDGQMTWPFIHPDDQQRSIATVMGWLGGQAIEPQETRIITPDGQERWIRVYTELEKDDQGVWTKCVNLLLDIDDGKRQELALIAAEKAAQAAAEAKSQFLANMSHEIRTPMNGVLGVLHLLERQALPSEAAAMLAEAVACGRMLQALLDDVVDFSRIEAGRLELSSEPIDPAAVVHSVARLLRPQAEAKGLILAVELKPLPPWVLGDPVRLRQCLFNLLGNAVKFTAKGQVAVRAAIAEGADGPRLRFEVEDTGVGIDDEAAALLFQRFQQADASTTRRFGGSGLGLAITRRLAELMDGSVGVRSRPGEGSVFWLDLPARAADAPLAAPVRADDILDGMRVLVVEDNATNRMIAGKILESLGAVVETAEDGEQGVAAAARGGFNIILMDIQMPGIDGLEATRRIRALGGPAARAPVIALTANVLTHQRDAYLAAGMDGVVGKPISPTALLAEIARLTAPTARDLSPSGVLCATSDRGSARRPA